MRISVFGIGYVGAVSAGCLASDGHAVVAVDPSGQLARGGVGFGRVAVAVAGEPHKTTRVALGQVMLMDHLADRLALDL